MKKFLYSLFPVILVLALMVFSGCSVPKEHRGSKDVLFQASTINALLAGIYDGDMTFRTLKLHGDFGLGTVNGLDGEMIALEGKFYQIKTDGKAYLIPDTMKTPFAEVTFFTPDTTFKIKDSIGNYVQLKSYLSRLLSVKNIFYAIKIEGTFSYIKTRSVPSQKKPYPLLVNVVKHQATFEFHEVKGTMVGFWCPAYVKGISVPGYHFHFITADRKAGGHVLASSIQNVTVKIDPISSFYMVLPQSKAFDNVDLTGGKQKELEKVEK
ncbi:MAG: alpha-acetolactate decarboxylase [bacterium]|nr:MAG: alpha-acetolactate decarboxylase [bacterium]